MNRSWASAGTVKLTSGVYGPAYRDAAAAAGEEARLLAGSNIVRFVQMSVMGRTEHAQTTRSLTRRRYASVETGSITAPAAIELPDPLR